MENIENKINLFESINSIKGVGSKISKYLNNKKIDKIKDLLLDFPYSQTDRSNLIETNELEMGKIATIRLKVLKYNFPRIKNLPNKIICEDAKGKIEIVYFNSKEPYLKKIYPLNSNVVVSGKVNYYKNKYQITNPEYVTKDENIHEIKRLIPKYALTEGLTEKKYRKIIENVLNAIPDLCEWHDDDLFKKLNLPSWKDSIISLHNPKIKKDLNSIYYKRLAFDEIFTNLLIHSYNREKIKKIKKKQKKIINYNLDFKSKIGFELTKNQKIIITEIHNDLMSEKKMFRILQGDVGSGKTIISFITALNVIKSGYQCALMAPTEILAKQHFNSFKKLFGYLNFNVKILTGKTKYSEKKEIIEQIKYGKVNFIFGTHSLFQKSVKFNNLGYVIIDEQHKFGVKQRMDLSSKGGKNCDILLMSATPIPRTMMMTVYGDMDISILREKPLDRKPVLTYSKPEKKIDEVINYVEKQINLNNQVFWVCPFIENRNNPEFTSVKKRYELINKKFPKKVGLIHGSLNKIEQESLLEKFLQKKIKVLISTTVIEVGIDFPNANLIIIDNSNKFGLAQLHQLRGRVGRGKKQGVCILMYKESLSKSAIKRIKILKSSNDGFDISEKDMQLRGFGDLIGFQQSGIKYFKIADPMIHKNLFQIAEKIIKKENYNYKNIRKYNFLLKFFDKTDII